MSKSKKLPSFFSTGLVPGKDLSNFDIDLLNSLFHNLAKLGLKVGGNLKNANKLDLLSTRSISKDRLLDSLVV